MKVKDFTHTALEYSIKGKWATLNRPIQIVVDTDKGRLIINVKHCFKWNGNSGSFPCRFHKTNVRYNVAILVHDVLYHNVGVSKAEADEILCGMLQKSGYGYFMSHLIHLAVDAFARCAFGGSDKLTLDNLDLISVTLNNKVLW